MTPRKNSLANQLRAVDNLKSAALAAVIVLLATGASTVVFGWIAIPVVLMLLGLSLAANQSAELMLRLRRAVPVDRFSAPVLSEVSTSLARRAHVPEPQLYILPGAEPNAMATSGRRGPILAVTSELLSALDREELEGVLAHEFAHLRHSDLKWSTAVETIISSASQLIRVAAWMAFLMALITGDGWLNWFVIGLMSLAVPTTLRLMQLSLSRTREFAADTLAAQLTGKPHALARALRRIEDWDTRGWPSILTRRGLRFDTTPMWLRSHPSTRERIERLLSLDSPSQRHGGGPHNPPRVVHYFQSPKIVVHGRL